jgi:hypothetical protein
MTPRLVGLAHLAATPLLLWSGACRMTDSCIAAGSRVATPDGWLAIELLQPGDSIYAVDVATGALVATVVTLVRSSQRECVALVGAGGQRLCLTPDHPVYAPGHAGFVVAGRFVLGQATRVLIVAEPGLEGRAEVSELGAVQHLRGGSIACSTSASRVRTRRLSPRASWSTTRATIRRARAVSRAPNRRRRPRGTRRAVIVRAPRATGAPTTSGTSTGAEESSSGTSGAETGGALFPCGAESCVVADEYCEVLYPGDRGETMYSCLAIPAACQPEPDCACLVAQGIDGECSETPEGALQVTIYGA